MSRATFAILCNNDRIKAYELIGKAPLGATFDLRADKRSVEQNALMWQRLTALSEQLEWGGFKLTADDWKDIMTAGLRRSRIVPNIDGDGFVQIGLRTSNLSTAEMAALLDLISAFGAQHSVTFKDEQAQDTPGDHQVAATNDDSPAVDSGGDMPPESQISENWRQEYLQCLTGVRDKAASLKTRHEEALQIIGGNPNEKQLSWMRLAWSLVRSRNEGRIHHALYEERMRGHLNAA